MKRLTRTAGGFAVCGDIGNTGVVKSTGAPVVGAIGVPSQAGGPTDGRTREAVARLLMEQGPVTAAQVAAALELSSPAVRRHLDALIADGEAEVRQASRRGPRGRGRPARQYLLTDSGRARFGHGYDDLAVAALRYLAQHGGPDAIAGFAQSRVEELLGDGVAQIEAAHGADARTEALATVLTARGYAAQARDAGLGVQLCQHHCPVAHVAAEFPALCEAETHAFAELLGTHVQRLATIARGDSACTTHVPLDLPVRRGATTTTTSGFRPEATIPRGRQPE
ncbi:ArsR family transcriptional regulator [Pseudonocardia sp.]|uniref:helix-turn-helix transcriptional regulator n=1 Tax=Pseudonocardia sp. TaxID=60912 RepID=UPI002607804B|nr:ArsR family transcriptional regulator [Pseudonocardia sp.]